MEPSQFSDKVTRPRKMLTGGDRRPPAEGHVMPALTAERFKQLVKTVEAVRAGGSGIKTAEQVHAAVLLDAQWTEVSFPQAPCATPCR